MALVRFETSRPTSLRAGMVVYSINESWGHAMLIEPTGDGLSLEQADSGADVRVLHHAPPLKTQDGQTLDRNHYLGIYDGAEPSQDNVLKDVCAAMIEIKARATASPALGLHNVPGCYSIAPSGILHPISSLSANKTTSCAGLVEECYREADVRLVDENTLPSLQFQRCAPMWKSSIVDLKIDPMN